MPLVISRTPLRISFFGGGTDYPDYYRMHTGIVLGTTINQYIHISVKSLQHSFFEHNFRIAYSKTELVKTITEIEHPSVRESLKFKEITDNLDIHVFADLPARTGLGSSSSFTVGFLHALYAFRRKQVSKQQLAEEACHVEQHLIQENVGSQDQFHAAFGGFNIIEFKESHVQVRPLAIAHEKKRALEDHLMVFFTGMTRHASAVVQDQVDKIRRRENQVRLQEMKALVAEAESHLFKLKCEAMLPALGSLLDEAWKLKKGLSHQITNPLVDEAYDAARHAGAWGGKLCGAGGGGFLIFLAPQEKQLAVRTALKKLPKVDCRFENEGSTIIYMKD